MTANISASVSLEQFYRISLKEKGYLKVEELEGYFLDEFVSDVFGVEFGPEFELQRVLFLHVLLHHLEEIITLLLVCVLCRT